MAFWCMPFMRVLMLGFGNLKLLSLLMDCSCIAPLTPVMIMKRIENDHKNVLLGHMTC
jgi:hypothetical protein